ncbi:hypothetical protein FJZ53_03885 [Candidatus Woesearchaeota archaeon]|nr:hypothetical protein [Candidatus Woesearchaeota archaeon]
MHKEAFIQSWKDLKEHPLVAVPDLVMLVINTLLTVLFLKYSGLLGLVTNPEVAAQEFSAIASLLKSFLKENLVKLVLSFTVFILTSFLIGSGFMAMKLGAMRDLMLKRKITIKTVMGNGRHVWQVISMKMIMFVIGFITFLFIIGAGVILNAFVLKGYGVLVTMLFFPILIIILQLLTFFRYQILFLESKHTILSVKESFNYFVKNKKHVLTIWGIVILLSFITAPISVLTGVLEQRAALPWILFSVYFFRSLIKTILNVWSDMFKFRTYKLNFKA